MDTLRKTDLRVIKTKRAIRQAFAELMSKKPLNEISVSDVAEAALINRKTFYAHYAGVHEIIAEIEDEIIQSLQALLAQKRFEDILGNPYDLFHDVMQIINRDIDVYGRLLTVTGNSNLVQKIIQMIRHQICSTYEHDAPVNQQTLDMTVYFMLSGLLAVFTEWYTCGRQQSIEELSRQLSRLCFDGVHGIMQKIN
ncbi:MAG: TetR/AcrR family transcriptional regulator C-terminal domain-containing protein [Clostridia bacterium]|nr:TetR/AcrR family transcriptional regulator C-terminal domain-containing protein [Clostridia bacterium]